MKKIISFFFLAVVMILFLNMAGADDGDNLIEVVFEYPTLFSNIEIIPGDNVTRWFEVTNITDDTLSIYLSTTKEKDFDYLGDQIKATIKKRDTDDIKYQNNLSILFDQEYVLLYELQVGESALFDFDVYFDFAASDNYQGKTVGFDVIIGAEPIVVQ